MWQGSDYRTGGGQDTADQALAAEALGWRMVLLPRHLPDPETARAALADIIPEPAPVWALWVGFINSAAVYRAVDETLRAANIYLINDTERHLDVFELDRSLPQLGTMTPETRSVTTADGAAQAAKALGYPVFLKGALSSRKDVSWSACVADDDLGVRRLTEVLLGMPNASRGRVMVRRLAPLIRREVGDRDFPAGREFRVFLLDGEVLGHGYYWGYLIDELTHLTPDEEQAMLDVAREAARRLPTRWVSLDIGQLEDKSWIVVEPGDPQFSGLSFIEVRPLWQRLTERVAAMPPPPGDGPASPA